eukprot:TRINITY_DN5331_c0_g1_i2.p1 TRINITY_DN5331_c0_g1~~TRINITY_DN5331_c0_g1_i2.p1  ORF type:complete len:683 (-),score=105.68 TRINITY_DN5331_c0_g1_i2:133-2181(-)
MASFLRSVPRCACLLVGLDVTTALVRASQTGPCTEPKLLEQGRHDTHKAEDIYAPGYTSKVWPKCECRGCPRNMTLQEAVAVEANYENFRHQAGTVGRKREANKHYRATRRNSSGKVVALQRKVAMRSRKAWPSIPRKLADAGQKLHDVIQRRIEPLVNRLKERLEGTPGVVHFLFVLQNSLPHYDIWRRFFESAPAGTWRAWAHCAEGCDEQMLSQFPAFRIVETAPSSYCVDLVSPMAQLLRASLKDGSIPHGAMEKFVFVSSTTLPTKPYHVVHKVLTAKGESDFCLISPGVWAAANIGGKDYRLVKHSQWVVLNRHHAEEFAKRWLPEVHVSALVHGQDASEDIISWNVSLPSIGEAAPMVVPRRWFSRQVGSPGGTCTDEEAVFSTVFGALEVVESEGRTDMTIQGFGLVAYDKGMPQQGKCHTYVGWNTAPGSIAAFVHDDPDSTLIQTVEGDSHPFEFSKLSNNSLAAVRAHASLFIRKISEEAEIKHWADIVFLDSTQESATFREEPRVPVYGQIRAPALDKDGASYCLDVDHAASDVRGLRWTNCSRGDQTSRFVFQEGSAGMIRWAGYPMEHRCLEVQDEKPTTGTAVVLGTCGDDGEGNNKMVFFVSRSSEDTEIRWAWYPDMCLELGGGDDGTDPRDSVALRLASCDKKARKNLRRFVIPDPRREAYDVL